MYGKKNRLDIAGIILGLILAVGVATVFGACPRKEDGTWMKCHQVQILLIWIGIGMAVLAIICMLVKQRMVRLLLCIAGGVLALVGALIPGILFSMCMMDTMRCHSVMTPFVRIVCALFLILMVLIGKRLRDE